MNESSGPLAGIRVLDLTSMISGPVATMMLADQGADVIKIEPPGGDMVRRMGRGSEQGLTSTFLSANRSKKSLALDLKSEAGMAVMYKLIPTADVLVQNFRPGAIERMGLGEAEVRTLAPSIIFVSISGFGEKGPYAHKRVYDPVIQALSGLADVQMEHETGRPKMIRTIVPDKTTSVTAAQAITAALFHRERTGQGQHVKLAMLDTMVAYLWPEAFARFTFADRDPVPIYGEKSPDMIFKTKDGYITAGAISDKEWQGLARAMDKPEWIEDERFATANARVVNGVERRQLTADILQTRTSSGRHEVLYHPQIEANELIETIEHPVAGPIRQARPAARFDKTPIGIQRHAPMLGSDGRSILRELNYGDEEISKLVADGVVVEQK